MMGRPVVGLVAAIFALVFAAAASADKEKVHFTAADQAKAKAIVLRLADLGGSANGWSGSLLKKTSPDTPLKCSGFNPKQGDLVLTGKAESDFSNSLIHLNSEAELLKTERMVKLDWARSVTAPSLVSCLRQEIVKTLPSGESFVSFRHLEFPKLGDQTVAFRGLFDVKSGKTKVRFMIDFALVAEGRSEITLITTAPYADASVVAPAEHRLAEMLASRAVPSGAA